MLWASAATSRLDAAGITLVWDDILCLPHLPGRAKQDDGHDQTQCDISITLDFVAIVLVMLGIFDLVVGAGASAGSVLVAAHSVPMLNWTVGIWKIFHCFKADFSAILALISIYSMIISENSIVITPILVYHGKGFLTWFAARVVKKPGEDG